MDYTQEQLEAELDQVHLVGVEDGVVVAVALLQSVSALTAKMRQVAVSPDRQGQGMGAQLVEAFEALAREMGHRDIVLHARDTAVPFYLKQGYEVEGSQFEEVGIPHHKMRKTLTT